MLFGVYGFVSGEKTAITTVPAQIASVPVWRAADADTRAAHGYAPALCDGWSHRGGGRGAAAR
jgi:hypothetical protein